jgi:hypothetical protein
MRFRGVAAGNGKYPAVLLITGSGAEDMNDLQVLFVLISRQEKRYTHQLQLFQIAQYLSERICSTST